MVKKNSNILIGTYYHIIDSRNRLFIPSKLRKNISKFVFTSGIDKCIYVYPLKNWESIVRKFDTLGIDDKSQERAFKRLFLSNAQELEIDKHGRVVIPQILKKQAGITRKTVIIGVWNRIEIWSEDIWQKYSRKSMEIFTSITKKLEI